MIKNIMIKIISVSFKNRSESLHVLTIPKEAYRYGANFFIENKYM